MYLRVINVLLMFFVIPYRKNVNAKEIIHLKLVSFFASGLKYILKIQQAPTHIIHPILIYTHIRCHFIHFSILQFSSFSLFLVMQCNISFFHYVKNLKVLETAVQNVSVADDLIKTHT